jgi:hypothetical protein
MDGLDVQYVPEALPDFVAAVEVVGAAAVAALVEDLALVVVEAAVADLAEAVALAVPVGFAAAAPGDPGAADVAAFAVQECCWPEESLAQAWAGAAVCQQDAVAARAGPELALQDSGFAASYPGLMVFSFRRDWAGAAAGRAFHVPVFPGFRIADSPLGRLLAFLFWPVPGLLLV